MSKPKITETDLCRAAKRLRTSTAEVETVAEVESAGNAYYSDGFPVILFERHKFHKFTKGKFAKDHPRISNSTGGGYSPPKGTPNEVWQRSKFAEAFALDPDAAMKSCSWGKFQLMGFNYEICGFDSVGAFVDAMKESEGRQLDAFVEFVIHSGLGDELRGHDWKGFARGYNGANYRQNQYDTKLEKAFEKFKKRKIHCGQFENNTIIGGTFENPFSDSASVPPSSVPDTQSATVEPTDKPAPTDWEEGKRPAGDTNVQVDSAQNINIENKPSPQSHPVKVTVERVSIWAKVGAGIAAVTGIGINFGNLVTTRLNDMTLAQLGYVLGGIAILAVALWLYDRAARRAHEKTLAKMATAADPSQNTIELREQVKSPPASGGSE